MKHLPPIFRRQRSGAKSLNSPTPTIPPASPISLPSKLSSSRNEWGLGARSSLARAGRQSLNRSRGADIRTDAPRSSDTFEDDEVRDNHDLETGLEPKTARADPHTDPAGLNNPLLFIRYALFSSWLNILLLLVPIGIISHPAGFPDVAVFILNFFAIIPLANLLGYATEQLALHLGESMGGLLNATFGNAVELLVGILALVKGEIEIVQSSLVGSILSNLLLVGGCCFFFGGIKNTEQVFNFSAAQSYSSLLAMAILSMLIPAAYNLLHANITVLKSGILTLSHVTSIFLLIIYVAYLVFQLKTHASLFEAVDKAEKDAAASANTKACNMLKKSSCVSSADGDTAIVNTSPTSRVTLGDEHVQPYLGVGYDRETGVAEKGDGIRNRSAAINGSRADHSESATAEHSGTNINRIDCRHRDKSAGPVTTPNNVESSNNIHNCNDNDNGDDEDDDDDEGVELTVMASIALLVIVTALTGVCAEFLVDSIDGLTTKWNLSRSFVGMILIPIVGNAAEHVTAVSVAIRNKMDLAISVAVGSSLQISLFVTPFLCMLGWVISQPMTIFFSPFTTIILFITIILVNYIIGDGRTNWLEGLVLIIAYIVIGVAYFLFPKDMSLMN